MYSLCLNLVLRNLKKAQKFSSVVYKYDKVSKHFHLHLDKKKINRALFLVRIYIFLLLLSLIWEVKKLSILHITLSTAFIITRLGIYSIFLIVSEQNVFLDCVHLMNKMIKYEQEILRAKEPGKLFISIITIKSQF